jgi:hypothetical protein
MSGWRCSSQSLGRPGQQATRPARCRTSIGCPGRSVCVAHGRSGGCRVALMTRHEHMAADLTPHGATHMLSCRSMTPPPKKLHRPHAPCRQGSFCIHLPRQFGLERTALTRPRTPGWCCSSQSLGLPGQLATRHHPRCRSGTCSSSSTGCAGRFCVRPRVVPNAAQPCCQSHARTEPGGAEPPPTHTTPSGELCPATVQLAQAPAEANCPFAHTAEAAAHVCCPATLTKPRPPWPGSQLGESSLQFVGVAVARSAGAACWSTTE